MTTRQRLIEMAARKAMNHTDLLLLRAAEAIEGVALEQMKGEYELYYRGLSQLALKKLDRAVVRRAKEMNRAIHNDVVVEAKQ